MKLDPKNLNAFLADPGQVRVILFHGDDTGLIRARAAKIVRAVVGSLDDPFRVVELDRDGFAAIPDEIASLSMTGGRRVIRIRDATESVASAVQAVLAAPLAGLLLLEAANLTARGKLRAIVERAPEAVAVACYPSVGRALEREIAAQLVELGVAIDADALLWLTSQLGADAEVTRTEVEKLAVYAGRNGRIDLEAAGRCVGDLAGLSLDDALFAATSGEIAGTDRALELSLAEGGSPVGTLRATLMHLHRLQRASQAVTAGQPAAEATKSVRPPIFFRREGAFTAALQSWPSAALDQACQRVWDAERACKRTGAPAETLARNALIGLAQRGAAARRRRRDL